MRVPKLDIFKDLHLDRCSQVKDFARSHFRSARRRSELFCRFGRNQERVPSDADSCMFCRSFLSCPLFSQSEVGYTGKTVDQTRLAPDSLLCPVPTILPIGFYWAMFFCQDVTDHGTLAGGAGSPLFVCDHSTPPLLGSKHGMGSLGFRWSYADIFGVLARGTSHCSCTEGPTRCSRHITCQRKCRCSQLRSVSIQRVLQWNGPTQSHGRSLRAVAFAVGRRSSSMVTSLYRRSAMVVLSLNS